MGDNNIINHTYQPKEQRSYRVVIKYEAYSESKYRFAVKKIEKGFV